MKIEIHEKGMPLDDSIHKHAFDRLAYELSSTDTRNLYVKVTLSELDERAGADCKYCNLTVTSDHIKELVVEEKAPDFFMSIEKASEKARRIMLGRIFQLNFYSRQYNSCLEARA